MNNPNIACVDLFCGAGGLTHGLIQAGVPVVAGVDSEESCRYPYEVNNEGAVFYKRDITLLETEEVTSWFGNAGIRILAACAPCQPFSSYTKHLDVKSSKKFAMIDYVTNIITKIKPEIVVMENVPRVTKFEPFNKFEAVLKLLGYEVSRLVVDSSNYGAAQHRNRTILIASVIGRIGVPTTIKFHPKTVRDAIGDLPPIANGESDSNDPLHISAKLSSLNLERVRASKPGGTWRDWPEHLVTNCHGKDSGSTYKHVYGRMEWNKPSPTITTQFCGFSNGRFGHPEQDRGLSLREGARLQGFPDWYRFAPSNKPIKITKVSKLIGNAVCVDLAKAIGRSIMSHVEKNFTSGKFEK